MVTMDNQERNQDNNTETTLHQAVKTKDVNNVADNLLNGGHVFINKLDEESKTPVHLAIELKLYEIVQLFLSTARAEITDDQYLIHYAIEKGDIEIVKLLVEHFPIEAKNKENMTAFCVAVKDEKFEILDYLLSLPSNVKISNYHALFHVAIIAGNIELVEKGLELEFPINNSLESNSDEWYVLNDHVGFTPLHLAVKYLRYNIIELLLNRGADILKKTQDGSTALHLAIEAKLRGIWKTWQDVDTNDKIIDTLLDITASNNAMFTNKNGLSHLHAACSRDKPEVIKKFLQDNSISGKDFVTSDEQGFACLHFAARYRCLEVAKVLLQHGVNVNQRNDELRTPLHIASKQTSSEFVQLLMQYGANLTLKDCHGNTPVHLAFNDRNYSILNTLFTNPTITNFNPTDSAGISHFHIACTRNDVSLIRRFINAGVDVNLLVPLPSLGDFKPRYSICNKDLNWRGCIPLHFAAAFNRVNIVQTLLMNGADIHRKDEKGYSPIHVASQHNYDRFGDLVTETLQKWKNDSSAQSLEWMAVQLQNRPYADVILVDEETKSKELDPYPRRFPDSKSQIDLFKNNEIGVIDWELNRKEQIDILELLFKHGADLNSLDKFGNASWYYIYDFHIHKLFDVLDQKLCLDKKLGTLIVRDFISEMYSRRLVLLNKIFSFGIPINVNMCWNNCSILHYICEVSDFWDRDRIEMVKFFLKKKADPNATDDLRLLPPRIAPEDTKQKYYDFEDGCVKLRNHSTPLHIITRCTPNQYNLEIVNLLLEADVDVNAKQVDGMTALHNLAFHDGKNFANSEMARTLVKYKALLDSRDNHGQTPLFLACLMKNFQVMAYLYIVGANVNIEDHAGRTLLYCFYKKHMNNLTAINQMETDTLRILIFLVKVVQERQEIGLPVNQKLVSIALKLDRYLAIAFGNNALPYKSNIKKEVENLKKIKVINGVSLYDVVFFNEHYLSRSLILEHLEKIIYSTEYYATFLNYMCLVKNKYHLAVERKSLLPMAMQTLDRVLSTTSPGFPVVCSDLILMYLTNHELENFIKAYADLTEFTIDNSKIKAYLKIRRTIMKYVSLNANNNFVVDLIIRRM